MERCFNITRISAVANILPLLPRTIIEFLGKKWSTGKWPYTYREPTKRQAWLQKVFEGLRSYVERESNWMLKQRCVME